MAGAASTRRGVKKEVFNAIRAVINGLIRNNDVLSDPSLTNVQALVRSDADELPVEYRLS